MTDLKFEITASKSGECRAFETFDEMGLPDDLLRGVYGYGWEKPSIIQKLAIVPQIKGHDLLAQANSGMGKSGSFGIGLLARITDEKKPQALVMSHTHELASQTANVIRALGVHLGVKVVLAVGGVPRRENVREIRDGAQVIVGTPGRVYDLASSGDLSFTSLRSFVIDEADEMLRDRFADQISAICNLGLPKTCGVSLFSATMPPEVRELATTILKDPVKITLKESDVKLDGIKQFYVEVDNDGQKMDVFSDLFETIDIKSSIIFCNTKERAERLYQQLTERGFPVSVIYGDPMTQADRKRRMDDFRAGTTRVLIATNLLARGIDVQQINMVFNFDIPPFDDKEQFIHRIGRCGRFGRKGTAISLLTTAEKDVMDQIAHHYAFETRALPEDLKGVTD